MGDCPACANVPLERFEPTPGIVVGLCPHCRGVFADRGDFRILANGASLTQAADAAPLVLGAEAPVACPSCADEAMQPLTLKSDDGDLWQCRSCGGLWLPEGTLFSLRRTARSMPMTRVAAKRAAPRSSVVDRDPDRGLAHSRSRFDAGIENLVGVPVMLLLSALICSTSVGRLFASLVGMPFHELGHAAASWLSSRIAIPLPFFTFWFDDQSVLMGIIVAGAVSWLGYRAYQENNRFTMGVAAGLLLAQAVFTLALPRDLTLMWQILSGAFAELLFGSFLLVAFHFPMPDRLRWDFWRWVAIVPGALCFTHAMLLWRRAAHDLNQMPWGAALGADSDGDMNRLVSSFGWSARELADFYLRTGYVCTLAIVAAYGYAAYRHSRVNGSLKAGRKLAGAEDVSR
ncbi:MAG: zf-TFIIB domain-containing protein [Myxococcota bacterium]